MCVMLFIFLASVRDQPCDNNELFFLSINYKQCILYFNDVCRYPIALRKYSSNNSVGNTLDFASDVFTWLYNMVLKKLYVVVFF